MKKIILPTDFSDNSRNAIRYALALFRDEECTFYLVNTYTPAVYQAEYLLHSPGQIGLGDIYQSHSQEQLDELKHELTADAGNSRHQFMTHSAFNMLTDEVRSLAENEGAELVVMGTQGASGAKEILFGTHTVQVLKHLQCPILVVPSGYEYEKPSEILFPTDYEVDFKSLPLKTVLEVAKKHNSRFEVLHVSTGLELRHDQKRHKKQLMELLSTSRHEFHDLASQEIITAINGFQQHTPCQMLLMVKNKHTFFERLFVEPIVKKIAFHIHIPFMVVPV